MAPRPAGVQWLCGGAENLAPLGLWAQGQQVFLQGAKHLDFSLDSPAFLVLGACF